MFTGELSKKITILTFEKLFGPHSKFIDDGKAYL